MIRNACIDRGETLKFHTTQHRTYRIEFVAQVFGRTQLSRGTTNQVKDNRWSKSGLVDLYSFNP